ncbi:bifunctional salicylyl-CoA 5-hydroxylase/oxidoreductase [Leekyejoonella antrihumi]|uniref:Bifunctional salicylyl-CoA 5-hydroxylase/oxidoreductase n=1 Tax=Leekyejoonella antrihumi TaxID=1660198 RepID=A0A563DYX5_9MICO|nr:bifunctional salicylyl-CoA 5-hydroxylase/oxidoreductase [Leekyejoonella antrihumi]TWP35427.1 bifunctional salicylyl-CoA 5-hydroxylase/oxidoreductase [Leekyejoonella antrihumi]
MRIAVIGGGPGGLYFAALAQQLAQQGGTSHDITVWERNAADDTFGFGVVFSDETQGGIEHADQAVYDQMQREFAVWDDIDVHFKGQVITSGGHGFAAMSRKRLLQILQERCAQLGVTVHFQTQAPDVEELSASHDLVVAADGVNSAVRARYADTFGPAIDVRDCRYMWLATDKVFDAFKFYIAQTPAGVMQIHGYPFDATGSTFIVEMASQVWRAAGFDAFADREFAPGESDEKSIAMIKELFADVLDGHEVIANNSRWISFATVRNQTWRHENVVILGDAAHTAHFSIGSGTKLAMEDALSLAACLHESVSVDEALVTYEAERKPVVESTQRAAQASLEWFEHLGQYVEQDPIQFAFNIMTRSRRVTYDNLRVRDPEFVARCDEWFAQHVGADEIAPPMFTPVTLRTRSGEGMQLNNRVIVSPMDQYVATDGLPGDFHLVHLGGKALGGAGLVMTEMVCTSPGGRITPGCTGMWADAQRDSWARVVDFVHASSSARIGIQLGHSGAKGSTKLMWEGIDQPLDADNWQVAAASPVPYREGVNQVPRELTRSELDGIREEFVNAARRSARAGFDVLELHCAHGYLLSGFLSPVTNKRTDELGGDVHARLRYPLEVFRAMQEVWPADRPMTVRISATDWVSDGQSLDDALEVARAFVDAGAAAIDVSTGQVTSDERPAFGRSYQTPYADAIRNRLGVPTIAVGVISSYDDVNSLLMAGRADLCALGRVHLYEPNWTLHAAIEQDYDGPGAVWPMPWRAGRRKPQTGRTDGPKPRLQLIREGEQGTRHRRWRP